LGKKWSRAQLAFNELLLNHFYLLLTRILSHGLFYSPQYKQAQYTGKILGTGIIIFGVIDFRL
jgi:hypothetical protein